MAAHGRHRRADGGHGALVPENAAGADLDTAIATGREGFGRLAAVLPEFGPEAWRDARQRDVDELVEQGVPEDLARAHAYLPALSYAPDVIAAAEAVGRSVEDAGHAFSLLGAGRMQIAWIQGQLDELPTTTRVQRWALQALRDDLWRARRELAQRALEQSPDESVEDAIDAFVESRREPIRRLESLARTLAGEGGADLAGLTLAVRQLRPWPADRRRARQPRA